MYTFSSKLKTFSFILMILGVLGIGYGFLTAPKNTQEVEAILAASHGEHGEATAAHDAKPMHEAAAGHETVAHESKAVHADTAHTDETHASATGKDIATAQTEKVVETDSTVENNNVVTTATAETAKHEAKGHGVSEHDAHAEHKEHVEHVYHQLTNKKSV
jgi:hypothetical protein